jgi:hypothetical protein
LFNERFTWTSLEMRPVGRGERSATNRLTCFTVQCEKYELTQWSRGLPEKLTGSELIKKFPAFYGTRRFITAFTRARHLSVFYRRISSVPRPLCMIRNMFKFLRWGAVSTFPKSQAGGSPLVGCPRLLFQYIRSFSSYLEAFRTSATWGRAMPWWQGPSYHGLKIWVWRKEGAW